MAAYIARKRMKIGESQRLPGEPIPEAAGWPPLQLHRLAQAGYIEQVPDPEPIPVNKRREYGGK